MSAVHCLINIVMIIVLSLLISMWWQESLLLEQDVKEAECNGKDTEVSSTEDVHGVTSVDHGIEQQENSENFEFLKDISDGSSNVKNDGSNISSTASSDDVGNINNEISNYESVDSINNSSISGNNINNSSSHVNNIDNSSSNVNNIDNSNSNGNNIDNSSSSGSNIDNSSSSGNNIDNSSSNGNNIDKSSSIEISNKRNCSCSCNNVNKPDFVNYQDYSRNEIHQNHLRNEESLTGGQLTDSISSSVVCFGSNHFDRQCLFSNLYYVPDFNEFAFLHTSSSEIVGVPRDRFNPALLDLSTVADHNAQYFNYVDLTVDKADPMYKNLTEASVIDQPCLIMRRFNPDNLMHIFHDDLLPIYYTIQTWSKTLRFMNAGKSREQSQLNESSSLRLVFVEGWDPGLYSELYEIFTDDKNYQPLYIEKDMRAAGKIIRFRSAVIGLSKHTIWYQYGFAKPQGPIENTSVTGYDIRLFARYIRDRLAKMSVNSFHDTSLQLCDNTFNTVSAGDQNSPQTCSVRRQANLPFRGKDENKDVMSKRQRNGYKVNVEEELSKSTKKTAVLLKRQSTRLILNELELTLALAQKLSLRVIVLSVETHSIREIVHAVSTCHFLIGMHGSLLIMSIFLPPGAQVIELFPYGINPSRYTPYRTLALLPGMNVHYASWRNIDKSLSTAHPNRTPSLGGISHLPEEEQRDIEATEEVGEHLCCSDPNWLYHINQDTRVSVGDVVAQAVAGVPKQRFSLLETKYEIFPSRVINITCQFNDQDRSLLISWTPPVNVRYIGSNVTVSYELWLQPVASESGDYSAWILKHTHHVFTVETQDSYSNEDSLVFGLTYNVWVRCLIDEGRTVGPFLSPSSPCRAF